MPERRDDVPRQEDRPRSMGRRRLLLGAGQTALLATALGACDFEPPRPEPFDDGTFFSDGTGWVE